MNEEVNFELKEIDGIGIFTLNEERFDSQIAGLIKGELTIFLNAENINKLIFDFSKVEYCDSSGLSSILLAFRILQSRGGHIRIAAPQKSVRTLIKISQLDKVLPVSETVESAISELKNL